MKSKPRLSTRILESFRFAIKFITIDMWRISGSSKPIKQRILINILKTIYISIRRTTEDEIHKRASALTYSTLLAVVPVLAILFAIAKGFGFENIVRSQLFDYFPSHRETLTHAIGFVNAYLEHAQGGVFVGVGLALLFWTVIILIGNIEGVFNEIWQIKKGRSFYRKIMDYSSLFLIIPVLMILSSGISIFLTTSIDNSTYLSFISPVVRRLISFSPYVLTCLLFTLVYVVVPNTRVSFWNALPAGILCGTGFQLFQFVYLSGQLWVSSYNAVYGSFAFLPLFLLWMQLSWTICLFGAVLTFSAQNIQNYDFEYDTKNINRRYKEYIIIHIASVIVKRFAKGEPPLTIHQISNNYHIPISLTGKVIYTLQDIGIINETFTDDERELAYQPALDISNLSVGSVLARLDKHGSEQFIMDEDPNESLAWKTLKQARNNLYKEMGSVLLKEL